MLQIKAMNEIKDNTVMINGTIVAKLTDTETEQLLSVINGLLNGLSKTKLPPLPNLNYGDEEPKAKKPYSPKDFKPKYEITKRDNLYCIGRAKNNGWTKAEKTLTNNAIKALKDIIEIDVPFTTKNGKQSTFKAWGYKTKKTAEKMLATLPTVITADEQIKFNAENK